MKKLKAKQIVTIVITALIGAGICVFPFIWNALHKPEKVAETVELPETSVKSTVNPDTPDNLLPNGYFKELNYGTGPFTPSTEINQPIAPTWIIPKSSTESTVFSVSFTENEGKSYNTISMKMTETPYLNVSTIVCELDINDFTAGENYIVSAYIIDGYGGLSNTYTEYTFEMPELAQYINNFGQGTLAGYPISSQFNYNHTEQTLSFIVGNINNYPGYYPETKIGAIKIEPGTTSTLKYDIEYTGPDPTYDEGYKAGHEEGYQEGLDFAKYGIFAGATSEGKMETSGSVLNAELKFLKNGISLVNYALDAENYSQKDEDDNAFIVTVTVIPFKWKNDFIFETMSLGVTVTLIGDDGKRYQTEIDTNNRTPNGYPIQSEYKGIVEKIEIWNANFDYHSIMFNPNDSIYNDGYDDGYNAGYDEGNKKGQTTGYNNGYHNGYEDGVNAQNGELNAAAAFIPQIFGSLLAFVVTIGEGVNVWGVSLWNILITLLTILLIVKVVKTIT